MVEISGIQLGSGMVRNSKGPLDKKTSLTTADRLTLSEVQREKGMICYDKDLDIYKILVNDPVGQDFTVESDWGDFGGGSSVVKKIYLTEGIKEEFSHDLNSGNLHVSVYFNGHPVEIAVNDIMENTITATSDISGLYTFVITKINTDFEYKNYASVSGTGIVVTNLISFTTENTYLGGTGVSSSIMIDGRLYAILFAEKEVREIDPITGLEIRSPINIGQSDYALRTDGKFLYTFGPNSNIIKIDISARAIVASLPASYPIGGVIEVSEGLMWIVESLTGILKEIDLSTFTYTGRQVTLQNSAWGLYGVVSKQNYLYVTLYYDGVSKGMLHRIEKTGLTYVDSVDTPSGCGVPILLDNEVIFPCYNSGKRASVDVVLNSLSREVVHPGVRDISNIRNKLYICGWNDSNVSEYNLDDNAYTGRVNNLGGSPESNSTF